VADINRLYRSEASLHLDSDPAGFEWIDGGDADNSVISFLRKAANGEAILFVCNFTPVTRRNYLVGVPSGGFWKEILNSDGKEYWGSGIGNSGGVQADPTRMHDRDYSLALTLPPLAIDCFKLE
jgi:1,4-alpha-glucan branching enzyme